VGFYDADGNLVGEETFPQANGALVTAKMFHPHSEQLERLIEMCVEQAWTKLNGQAPTSSLVTPVNIPLPEDSERE
jgi:hypothetical protein